MASPCCFDLGSHGRQRAVRSAAAQTGRIEGALFGAAIKIVELGSPAGEGNPSVTGDGLEIYFDSSRGAGYALYSATRPDTSSMWQNITRASALYLGTDVTAAYITPDGLTLYYMLEDRRAPPAGLSRSAGVRDSNLMHSPPGRRCRDSVGTTERYARASSDQLTLYYQAGATRPELDLFAASRPSIASPFGVANMLGEHRRQR